MRKKFYFYLAALSFFFYLFLTFDINFRGPDEPIYFAYTASLVEDGDLNAVDQVYAAGSEFSVSPTYNLPDFHNHGGVVFWAPFYIYGKLIYGLAYRLDPSIYGRYTPQQVQKCAMAFSTIFFGFLALLLVYLFCRVFFPGRIIIFTFAALFFGTPLYEFVFLETGNANIVALLCSILSLWFCVYALGDRKRDWFVYGLFFSFCSAVKTELLYQTVFLFLFFIFLLRARRAQPANGFCFGFGFLCGFSLKVANDLLKYGVLHAGGLGLFNFRDFYFFEQLFSSYRGIFYVSPLFYICLLGLFLLLFNLFSRSSATSEEKEKDIFLLLLSSYLVFKLFMLSFRYAWGGGSPGARVILAELPVLGLLYARAFWRGKKTVNFLLACFSLAAILWNIVLVYEIPRGIDVRHLAQGGGLNERILGLGAALESLLRPRELGIKVRFCLPLLFIALAAIFYIIRSAEASHPFSWQQRRGRSGKTFLILTAILITFYAAATMMNMVNNRRNAAIMKANGFFSRSQAIGREAFEREENSSSIDEMILYFSLKGDSPKVKRLKEMKEELYP